MARTTKKFASWAAEWLILMKPTVKGNTFAASYRSPVNNHLIPYFGEKALREIKQADIQRYINTLALKFSRETVKKHKYCLRQIFEKAVLNNHCKISPVTMIKIPKTKPPAVKFVYSAKQVETVYDYAYTHRFGAEIQFMLDTGVSRGELLAIRWADVDLDRRCVSIRHGAALVPNDATNRQEVVIGDTKNAYRMREIPLENRLCEILRDLPQRSEYLFCNKDGGVNNPRTWSKTHYDRFMKDMQAHFAAFGVDFPAAKSHELRHTKASVWAKTAKREIAAAKALGHSNMEMLLKTYAHYNVDEIRENLCME